MFYPSSCVFVYACLGKDNFMGSLRCLDWMTSKRSLIQIIAGLPFGDLNNSGHGFDKFTRAIFSQEYFILTHIYKFSFSWP